MKTTSNFSQSNAITTSMYTSNFKDVSQVGNSKPTLVQAPPPCSCWQTLNLNLFVLTELSFFQDFIGFNNTFNFRVNLLTLL